jgi:ABC-type uncharacterized transport system substrate-binding protein
MMHEAKRPVSNLKLHVLHASTEQEMEAAFTGFSGLQVGVLMIGTDAFFNERSQQLAKLALRYKVPTIYQHSSMAERRAHCACSAMQQIEHLRQH